jgi:hypothetical protein
VKPLFALMAVLAGLLGWECLPAQGDDPSVVLPASVPPVIAPEVVAAPVANWVDAVLARPLFATDRRPKLLASSVAASRAGVAEVLPRLAGTVRSDYGLMAIFALAGTAPNAGQTPVVVGRDGIVAAWTVVDIIDGGATLERDGRVVTLRLSYSNAPVAPHVVAPEALVLLHDKRTSPFLQP